MFIKEENQDQEEKEYGLGPIAFGTLYKNWSKKRTGYKARLLKIHKKSNDAKKQEIDASINQTEILLEKYFNALKKWKEAARKAKEQYDEKKTTYGKVKTFFGFDSGKQDDKTFQEYDGAEFPFVESGGVYTIKDILSMDFNIGLMLDDPLQGEGLKEETERMVAFVRFFKEESVNKKKKQQAGEEGEEEQENTNELEKQILNLSNLDLDQSLKFYDNLLQSFSSEENEQGQPVQESTAQQEAVEKLSKLKEEAAKQWEGYIGETKDIDNNQDFLRFFSGLIQGHWFLYLYLTKKSSKTLHDFFMQEKKKWSSFVNNEWIIEPDLKQLKKTTEEYFNDLTDQQFLKIDMTDMERVFLGSTEAEAEDDEGKEEQPREILQQATEQEASQQKEQNPQGSTEENIRDTVDNVVNSDIAQDIIDNNPNIDEPTVEEYVEEIAVQEFEDSEEDRDDPLNPEDGELLKSFRDNQAVRSIEKFAANNLNLSPDNEIPVPDNAAILLEKLRIFLDNKSNVNEMVMESDEGNNLSDLFEEPLIETVKEFLETLNAEEKEALSLVFQRLKQKPSAIKGFKNFITPKKPATPDQIQLLKKFKQTLETLTTTEEIIKKYSELFQKIKNEKFPYNIGYYIRAIDTNNNFTVISNLGFDRLKLDTSLRPRNIIMDRHKAIKDAKQAEIDAEEKRKRDKEATEKADAKKELESNFANDATTILDDFFKYVKQQIKESENLQEADASEFILGLSSNRNAGGWLTGATLFTFLGEYIEENYKEDLADKIKEKGVNYGQSMWQKFKNFFSDLRQQGAILDTENATGKALTGLFYSWPKYDEEQKFKMFDEWMTKSSLFKTIKKLNNFKIGQDLNEQIVESLFDKNFEKEYGKKDHIVAKDKEDAQSALKAVEKILIKFLKAVKNNLKTSSPSITEGMGLFLGKLLVSSIASLYATSEVSKDLVGKNRQSVFDFQIKKLFLSTLAQYLKQNYKHENAEQVVFETWKGDWGSDDDKNTIINAYRKPLFRSPQLSGELIQKTVDKIIVSGEFEGAGSIRGILNDLKYKEYLKEIQKDIPLFIVDENNNIKDINNAFYDVQSIVRKLLNEKGYGARSNYSNYLYPPLDALNIDNEEQKMNPLSKMYRTLRISRDKPIAQKMLFTAVKDVLELLPSLIDAKHQEMLRDLQALTKYYEGQKKPERVKAIKEKIKENKVSEVYKFFYNFIKKNKPELLKYFENNDQELSTPEEPKEKTEDEVLKEKLEAVVGTKIKDKGTIVFIAEFHKDEEGKYKKGPTAKSSAVNNPGVFYQNVFDRIIDDHILMDTPTSKEDKLFLLRYKKEGEEFNNESPDNGRIITEKEFLNLYEKSSSASDTQEKDLEEQKIEKLDFKDSGGREFFIINTKKYGKIAYYTSSGTNTRELSVKGTPVPFIGIVYAPDLHPTWFYKFNSSSGPEGITFEKNPQDYNVSPQDKDFKNYRSQVAKLMEKEKTQIYSIDKINDLQDNLFGSGVLSDWWNQLNEKNKTSFLKYIPFAIKLNRTLKEKGALREDFMRTTKYPLWGIDDITIKNFVISKDVSILDRGERVVELSQFLKKLKNLNSLNDIAEEYIKLFKKLGGDRKNVFSKKEYIRAMETNDYRVFSRLGFEDKLRQFIKNRVEELSSPKQNTQEQLIKLIKPLIREKLKRKQNGKKNLRN